MRKKVENSIEYIRVIRKPNLDMFAGIRVDRNTDITFRNEYVEQTIKNLVLHTISRSESDEFTSIYDIKVKLNEGDILIFEEESRGYIKPVEELMTIPDAIKELEFIKDL